MGDRQDKFPCQGTRYCTIKCGYFCTLLCRVRLEKYESRDDSTFTDWKKMDQRSIQAMSEWSKHHDTTYIYDNLSA